MGLRANGSAKAHLKEARAYTDSDRTTMITAAAGPSASREPSGLLDPQDTVWITDANTVLASIPSSMGNRSPLPSWSALLAVWKNMFLAPLRGGYASTLIIVFDNAIGSRHDVYKSKVAELRRPREEEGAVVPPCPPVPQDCMSPIMEQSIPLPWVQMWRGAHAATVRAGVKLLIVDGLWRDLQSDPKIPRGCRVIVHGHAKSEESGGHPSPLSMDSPSVDSAPSAMPNVLPCPISEADPCCAWWGLYASEALGARSIIFSTVDLDFIGILALLGRNIPDTTSIFLHLRSRGDRELNIYDMRLVSSRIAGDSGAAAIVMWVLSHLIAGSDACDKPFVGLGHDLAANLGVAAGMEVGMVEEVSDGIIVVHPYKAREWGARVIDKAAGLPRPRKRVKEYNDDVVSAEVRRALWVLLYWGYSPFAHWLIPSPDYGSERSAALWGFTTSGERVVPVPDLDSPVVLLTREHYDTILSALHGRRGFEEPCGRILEAVARYGVDMAPLVTMEPLFSREVPRSIGHAQVEGAPEWMREWFERNGYATIP